MAHRYTGFEREGGLHDCRHGDCIIINTSLLLSDTKDVLEDWDQHRQEGAAATEVQGLEREPRPKRLQPATIEGSTQVYV